MIQYKPGFIPTNFVIIGAGGTGSRLVPLLAQFLKTTPWIMNPRIFIIDHDSVEDKNLLRQNFIRLDLNRPKAVVLAERYSRAFDINIIPIVKKVEDYSKISNFILEAQNADGPVRFTLSDIPNTIFILAVDSAQARKDILYHITARSNLRALIIDAGNENDFGQIQVFHGALASTTLTVEKIKEDCSLDGNLVPVDIEIPYILMPLEFYSSMKDASTTSCADLDQTLAINAMMATSIMGIVQSYLYNKLIPFYRLNISLLHGITPEFITLKYLLELTHRQNAKGGTIGAPAWLDYTRFYNMLASRVKDFKTKLNPPKPVETEAKESVKKKSKGKGTKKQKTDTGEEIEVIIDLEQDTV